MQTGCPLQLWLEASCHGNRDEEMAIHHRLIQAKAHHRGEWFKDCEEAQKILAEMRAGSVPQIPQAATNDLRLEQRHKRLAAVLDFNERKTRQWGM